MQRLLLELREAVEDGVTRVAVLAEALGEGEPEEVRGLHEGAKASTKRLFMAARSKRSR